MTIRTVAVKLIADIGGYTSKLGQASAATKGFMGELDKLGRESPEKFNRLALGMGVAGAALLGVAGVAVKTAMTFDKEMSSVASVAGATADQMGQLRQSALDAGKATVFSATESAQAEEELAKAGISVKDILGGGLKGALDLAAAGQMGLADAATIAAQAMNIFGLRGAAVPHIADVLAAAANKSAADMKDLGDALKQGGLLANQAGLSLEDTTGTLAAFADRALIGSDAGTSLKTMLQQLAGPSAKSAELMKELGLNVYDAQGQFIGITKLAGLLQDKLGGLTQAQRDQALATIFGSDATRAANVLYSLGEKGLQGYIDAVDDSGAASETAAKKTDNLAGDVERLKGSLETLAIGAGSGANGGLRLLVKAVDGLVSGFSDLPGPVQTTTTVLVGVSGAGLLAAAGLLKARQTVQEMLSILEGVGPAGTKAAGALRTIGGIGGRLGLVGLAVGGIWMGLDALSDWAKRKNAPLKADIDKLTASMKDFAATGTTVGELADKYGSSLNKIGTDVTQVTKGIADMAEMQREWAEGLAAPELGENWDPVDPDALQRVEDLDTALAGLVNNGNAVQANLFMERLRASGAVTAEQYSQLVGMLPQYTSATRDASIANSGLAKGFADASTAGGILSGTLSDAISKGQTLTDVWNTLHGALLGTDKAMLDANRSIDAVKKSFEDNGNAIAGNSTKALENRIAIEESTKAAAAAAQAKYTETGSITAANAVYDGYITQLRKTLHAAHLTDAQINQLLGTYATMPPVVKTEVKTPGLDRSIGDAHDLKDALDALKSKTITVKTEFYSYRHDEVASSRRWGGITEHNRWGGITTHAQTGLLREAATFTPQGPARYAFAEPATGGEAFVPRHGDYARSTAILAQASRWYGGSFVPGGGGSAAPAVTVTPTFNVRVLMGTRDITDIVRIEVDRQDQAAGRRADLMRRTG